MRDELLRLPGISDVVVWGAGEYSMRLWLDPDLIASRGLTAGEVIAAVREQNRQVAAGAVGQAPDSTVPAFQVTVNTLGRLSDEEQFGDIIVRTGADGQMTRLRDVARIEMGGDAYALRSLLDGEPAVAIQIFQSPGANALDTAEAVRATVGEARRQLPGRSGARASPTTRRCSSALRCRPWSTTLLEAILLVVVVVVLFLRSWRASLIPLMAVPVSLVGTFAVMHLMGFSLNTLSLFGLVLSIGIVVDDAIVVVENVERHIETASRRRWPRGVRWTRSPGRSWRSPRCWRRCSSPRPFSVACTGRVLSSVRPDHRHLHHPVGAQLADPQPGPGGACCCVRGRPEVRWRGASIDCSRPSADRCEMPPRPTATRWHGGAGERPGPGGVRGLLGLTWVGFQAVPPASCQCRTSGIWSASPSCRTERRWTVPMRWSGRCPGIGLEEPGWRASVAFPACR